MQTLQTFANNIVFRRPALKRWSVFEWTLPAMHEFIATLYNHFQTLADLVLNKYWDTIRTAEEHFTIPICTEIKVLLSSVDRLFEIVHDYAYDVFISGEPNVQNILNDTRLQSILDTVVWGKPISTWLVTPMTQLLKHFGEHLKLPFTFLKTMITHRLSDVLHNLKLCQTVDELIRVLTNKNILDAVIPIERIIQHYKIQHLWVARDVYYEALRSLLIIPHLLVDCVENEWGAQQRYDVALRGVYRQMKQTLFHKSKKRSRHHQSTSSTTSTSTRTSDCSGNHRVDSEFEQAKDALAKAEDTTSQLVEWNALSVQLALQRKSLYEVIHDAKHKASWVSTLAHTIKLKKKTLSGEQLQIQKEIHTTHDKMNRVFGAQPKTNSPKNIFILDYHPLDIALALASPYHIYHTKRSQSGRLLALTHHLHSLGALGPFVHVMKDETDNTFCRHLKDVPAFGLTGSQKQCIATSEKERDKFCNLLYTITKDRFPRDTMLNAKGCFTCKDVRKSASLSKKSYHTLKHSYCKATST